MTSEPVSKIVERVMRWGDVPAGEPETEGEAAAQSDYIEAAPILAAFCKDLMELVDDVISSAGDVEHNIPIASMERTARALLERWGGNEP